ncbi:MAG TPA: autotransporter domain-containing protein [Candidatus Deferrimicrobiaceae bacterium]
MAGVVSKGRGISFGMGGGGGTASDGGAVDVDSASDIVTHDNNSHAIFAQSLGGGGGSGGFSVAGSVTADNSAVAAVGISIGGSGGGGGNAGNVAVTSTGGNVVTFGERSYGILAQSLGGGGGDGGFSVAGVASKGRGISFSMGGGGGTAGTGGTVAVDSSSDIATHDNNSHAIFAQSLGGGGGSGGFSVAGSVSADNAAAAAIGISIGGFGAGGGNADNVTVDSTGGTIFTGGARSYGILAQSVGGGGGDGGFSVAGGIGKGGGATFSLGGFGDIGGHGRAVEVRNASDIGTLGEESHAIFAQSVGGGGGSGGFSVAGSVAWDNAAASVGISIGGFGGGGGNGDRVTVDNHGGFISTGGDNATGILAQSIGGGGGNGGFSIAGSFGFDNATKSVSVAVGGFGGKGGFGGDVDVSNSAAVVTEGNRSEGIFAQSIGGGGGSGGFAFAGTWGGAGSKNVSFSLGGYGGDGNYAGNVSVRNDNAIDTSGVQAHGIFAQSVGGGGGKGGWSIAAELGAGGDNTLRNVNLGVGIGGGGGDGGYGGAVSVANSHRIVTRGTESHGIFAQSIGGGGGNGGFAFSGMLAYGANDKGTNVNVAVAVGGGGGDGNHGGSVTVVNTGDIAALDNNSNGIFAQSLGGGGGNGGQASTFSMMFDKTCPIKYVWCKESKDGEDDWSFSVAVGGSGGGASNGGAVDVTNSGNIVTRGADSAGIFAQSIGGGGGTGGNGGSIGKSDILGMFAPEQLDFLFSTVSGFKEWDVMVGGSGGSSGNGDNVTVRNTGNITTYGSSTTMMDGTQLIQDNVGSYGIFAQSIGGGGGVGGNAATGLFGKIGLGGGAGSAGDGGAVKVENSGRIETFGDGGHAILAQSGGGGGGIAGDVERGKIPLTDINVGLNVAFGRGGGNSGDGGAVTVDSTGDIVTHGRNSFGIFAQSFGGGGGIAGNAGFLGIPLGTLYDWFAGSVGGDGSGGAVTVKSSGRIETFGDGSHGIFAQSAGGKGDGGTVHVDVAGDILAHGVGTDGIFAQSRGNDGGGNITVDINAGTVQGGTGAGAGVRIAEGANNTLTNRGTITTEIGAAGNAVIGTKGNETIINHGTVTGSVDLGEGSNSFRNMAGATFNPGAKVQLGGGNTLTNDGILSPGGAGVVQTTVLGGNLVNGKPVGANLVQSGTGKYEVDLDLRGGKADRIELDGIADLAGQVEVHLTDNLGLIPSGTHRYYILSGADNVNASGLALIYQPSAVMKYEMIDGEKDGEKYVELSTTVDFSPRGISLTGNQSAIGQAINAIQLAGGTEAFAPVVAELVRMTDPKNIALAYEQMNPVDYASFSKAIHDATRQYTQNLLKRVHSVRAGLQTADSRLERGDREQWLLAYSGADESIRTLTLPGQEERRKAARYGAWLDFFGQNGNQDAGHDANMINGYEFRTVGWSVGLDYLFGEKFLAGASIGTSGTDVDLDFQKGNGDIRGLFGSLYGSYFTRQFYLDMALSYGRQWFDNRRNYTFAGNPFTASSSHDGDLFSGYVEGGYNFQRKNWVLQPYAGLQYISLSEEAFSETGAGPLNLDVSKQNNGSLVSELGLRLEYVIPVETGNFLPEVTVAWSYDFGIDDPVVTASFAGAPGNSFSVTGRDGENCGLLVGAGVNFFGKSGFSTSLKYRGEFRDHYQSHAILGELIRYEF